MSALTKVSNKKPRIGIAIAFFVIALIIAGGIVGALLHFPNDILDNKTQRETLANRKADYEVLQAELTEIGQQAQKAKERTDVQASTKQMVQEIKTLQAKKESLEGKHAKLSSELTVLHDEFQKYVDSARSKAQEEAIGTEIEALDLANGSQLKDITIREITATGIRVKQGYSYKTLKLDDLTQETLDSFLLGNSNVDKLLEQHANLDLSLPDSENIEVSATIQDPSEAITGEDAKKAIQESIKSLEIEIGQARLDIQRVRGADLALVNEGKPKSTTSTRKITKLEEKISTLRLEIQEFQLKLQQIR